MRSPASSRPGRRDCGRPSSARWPGAPRTSSWTAPSSAATGAGRKRSAAGHKQEVDAWYSGKNKDFGGNIQGLFYPDGRPIWVSDVLPGRVNDLAAAKELVFAALRPFTGQMPCLADGGYEPAGHGARTPVKRPRGGPDPGISAQTRNMLLRSLRCLGLLLLSRVSGHPEFVVQILPAFLALGLGTGAAFAPYLDSNDGGSKRRRRIGIRRH